MQPTQPGVTLITDPNTETDCKLNLINHKRNSEMFIQLHKNSP